MTANNNQGGKETQTSKKQKTRIPNPGTTMRQHRISEALALLKLEVREQNDWLDDGEVERRARKQLDALRKNGQFDRQYSKTAPTSTTPTRSTRNQNVELAAVLRLPWMRWWWDWMLRARAGRPGKRSMVLALFCQMAFQSGKPDILNTWKGFHRSDMRDFTYGELQGPSQSALYRSMESMLNRRWPQVCRHINLAMFQELISQTNDAGEPLHPDAGKYLVVDGTLLEAHAQQRPARYVDDVDGVACPDDEHERLLRGKRTKAAYMGQKGKELRGYKLMLISDLATGLPLMFRLYPATVNERKACIELLERLFSLWPECPAQYLVGDAAYDHDKAFVYDLVFRWGLHPVFPPHLPYDSKLPYTKDNADEPGLHGVPHCRHGLMKVRDHDRWWDAKRRAASGIARGEHAPDVDARIRWVCAKSDKTCKGRTTRPRDDARVYTYLPHVGSHVRVALREALLVRRNSIESIFAQLKGGGQGGPRQWRAFWAEDKEMEWLLYAALMFITARRLAGENGDYDRIHEEADRLGLLAPNVSPLSELDRKRMLKQRAEGEQVKPATWTTDEYREGGYYHGSDTELATA